MLQSVKDRPAAPIWSNASRGLHLQHNDSDNPSSTALFLKKAQMNVNGFLLREAIKKWELRRDTAYSQFDDTLHKFPGEEKESPDVVHALFTDAESAIAKLETAQAKYNLKVVVEIAPGHQMTLCEAVKRLGGAARAEKMWKTAANPKKEKYSFTDTLTRDKDKERAVATLSSKYLIKRANEAAAYTSSLRAAIARGNGTEIPADQLGLDPALLTE